MRGPSSSHSAAACRIGRLTRELIDGNLQSVVIDYDPNGSLVTTHESQGTDMGLYGGLLGWEAHDDKMVSYREYIERSGIQIQVNYVDYSAKHPNTYRISVSNEEITHNITAISTGGGMIEVKEIDGSNVSIYGDYHELLVYGQELELIRALFPEGLNEDQILIHKTFIEIKSSSSFDKGIIAQIEDIPGVQFVRYLKPVLPVLSRRNMKVPFSTCAEMMDLGKDRNLQLWELAVKYEAERGKISEKEVFSKMLEVVHLMKRSTEEGLKGTNYEDRILPAQSPAFRSRMKSKELLDGGILNTIVLYVTAMMEVKSSMGVIVAAPTAGSCGVLPGSILGAAEEMDKDESDMVKAMLAAGIAGSFIAQYATFSAEVAGCQAECGAGSAMAAAGLVTLGGGDLDQCIAASSLALQNSLGMICDPIGVRVEAPCLGKNVMAASNALSCANMALSGFDPLIPFDEVILAMNEVSDRMAHEHRCTGLGGLANTPAAREIEKRLQEKMKYCS